MATQMPPTRPVANVGPITPWQREDPRQAILARLLSPDGKPLPVAATDATPMPGGLIRARLLETRSGNEALVDINGKSFLIRTRQPLPTGASVLLRVMDVSADDDAPVQGPATRGGAPLPGQLPAGAAAGEAGDAAPVTPQRPQAAPVETLRSDTGDARVRVSGPARLLSELAPPDTAGPRPIRMAPLGGAEQADPTRAAQQMRNAVEQSGLFYESHVQAWSEGRRPLDSLRAEPQGTLPSTPAPAQDDAAALPEPRALNAALASIPASVRPLVQDQIALLETGQLGLQGVWQGQPFSVRIEPDEEEAETRKLPGERLQTWRVRIDTEAPALGRLQIDIGLSGENASVRVRAENAAGARSALTGESADLADALAARGVKMHELNVDKTPLAPAQPAGARGSNSGENN